MRSPEQLLKAYEAATKERPLMLKASESENFSKAMKIANAHEDVRLGKQTVKTVLQDKDILLRDGIVSPLDQKTAFSNRREWNDHLKRNGCVEIGNDYNNSTQKKREIKGDFDCRNELAKVTHQVMDKYGH